MNISKIDLNLFVVFDAIYTEGSVSAAARKLNLSQPAISHALARLRILLGDPLFERQGQRMVSTFVARGLIEPVRAALRALELTLRQADHFDPATSSRQFSLAMRDVLESATLPALMRQVVQQAPHINIAASRVARRELVTELALGTVDAAIDVLLPLPPEVKHTRLARENTVVVARRGHPAIGADGLISLDEYLSHSHVLVSSRRQGQGLEDFELSRLGYSRRIRLRCQHYGSAGRVVSQTDLLLTMPDRYAHIINEQYDNHIMPLPVAFTVQAWELYLYWHEGVDRDPANGWLREQITRAYFDHSVNLGSAYRNGQT
jgi:DNA-binding transcriptional LysR family regulator